VIEEVTRDEVVPLRHEVLRTGLPIETARYPEDDSPQVFHLADREPDGTIIACVSFFPEDLGGEPGWRFRGMATRESRRNTGVGGRLLEAGVDEVVKRGGTLVWCNGRSAASAFYLRHGFKIISDEYVSGPRLIPHYLFARSLG
jgi:predicted GNAT family N-acyltransferase